MQAQKLLPEAMVNTAKLPNVLLDIVRPVLLMRAFSAKTWETVQTRAQMSK